MKWTWETKRRASITVAHRPYWRKLKAANGAGSGSRKSVCDITGFTESIDRLLKQGWCATDIGVFFGVSRERARQWIKELGLKALEHGTMPRVWDPDLACFRPIRKADAREEMAEAERRAKRLAIAKHRRAMREEHVAFIQLYHEEYGYGPSTTELGEFFNTSWSGICQYWRVKRLGKMTLSYAECYALMNRLAGVEPRVKGSPGHTASLEAANGGS
jgi:hypothetical protein